MTDKEAMKQIISEIDALPEGLEGYFSDAFADNLAKVREALAQPEQEPIARFTGKFTVDAHDRMLCEVVCSNAIPTAGAALYDAPPQRTEHEADSLYFSQWTASEKDLSDYICVGSLTLAGIEDGEYGQSEVDLLDNTIDALQEKLITGPHKKVPLLAYIGGLNTTPSQRTWVSLTDEDLSVCDEDGVILARYWEAKLKEKNT